MRNQKVINEKIRQAMLNRVVLGIHKNGKPFSKGYDPRRKVLSIEERKRGGQTAKIQAIDHFQNASFETLGKRLKRRRIVQEQNFKCLWCKHDTWLNKPIVLELDHIDGNKKNDSRENLRCLCPNCHAQTDTWRRKKCSISPPAEAAASNTAQAGFESPMEHQTMAE